MTRNVEDMESQSVEHHWSNYNPLVLIVKLSCDVFNNFDGLF